MNADTNDRLGFLYSEYYYACFKMAYYLLNNREDAEDCVQEVFLKIVKLLSSTKYTIDTISEGLCITITRNQAYDYLRKKTVFRNKVGKRVILDDSELSNLGQPEKEYIDKEDYKILVRTINELDSKYRVVLELKYLHGLSDKDGAKLLGILPVTYRSRLSRSRNLLLRKLEKKSWE